MLTISPQGLLDDRGGGKERWHEAWALLVLGQIGATHELVATLDLGEALGMRPMVAQCHFELGVAQQRLGQLDRARDHLLGAATMFRDLDMGPWVEKTGAQIANLTQRIVSARGEGSPERSRSAT